MGSDVGERVQAFRTTTRHKSIERRIRRELRVWLPLVGFLSCYSASAVAIVATEIASAIANDRAKTDSLAAVAAGPHFLTISSSSTSKVSSAFGSMPGRPRSP